MISAAVPGANEGSGPHALAAAVSGRGRGAADRVASGRAGPDRPAAGPDDDMEGAPVQPARTITTGRPQSQRRRVLRTLT